MLRSLVGSEMCIRDRCHRCGSLSGRKTGFDNAMYARTQVEWIKERLRHFPGRLYMEVGGHFAADEHAARVLPGFDALVKPKIFSQLIRDGVTVEILFCLNAADIRSGRRWGPEAAGDSYAESALAVLGQYSRFQGLPRPRVVFNRCEADSPCIGEMAELEEALHASGYRTYKRFEIAGYPHEIEHVLGPEGFLRDEHVTWESEQGTSSLVLVTAIGSSSGKMGTCLGQTFLDREKLGIESGYAKYELFPIWNIPLEHPLNLAYEAAECNVGDVVLMDPFYNDWAAQQEEVVEPLVAVNYNRDIDAFPLLMDMIARVVTPENYMRSHYHSPTHMGINAAGLAIVDDAACSMAALQECERRLERYRVEYADKPEVVEHCERIAKRAREVILVDL
eukprot:TRINITY_DN4258_c0_g1_i1.p1 TRINITY_DN4258_c0_g1~~TRINITY_DN4258_c0_g1_i1.p1  ORF type:complete len:393 (+),score=99.40 TRINITY_DN4258_c0_g1_i1:148-1326(+)